MKQRALHDTSFVGLPRLLSTSSGARTGFEKGQGEGRRERPPERPRNDHPYSTTPYTRRFPTLDDHLYSQTFIQRPQALAGFETRKNKDEHAREEYRGFKHQFVVSGQGRQT
ncbi:hypothetical protein CDV31_006671 [Fusarium ambrosium]|nr:hypothetical protein CDV31_006671 [Fusarium ambrosium]